MAFSLDFFDDFVPSQNGLFIDLPFYLTRRRDTKELATWIRCHSIPARDGHEYRPVEKTSMAPIDGPSFASNKPSRHLAAGAMQMSRRFF
jgi:hypothetical protein